jgi:xylulokinase
LAGVSRYVEEGRIFQPRPEASAVYDRSYANFRDIYERLKTLYPKLSAMPEGHG